MARRDAVRHPGRSLLIVVMIALPVLALSGADVLARTMQLSATEKIARTMGRAAAGFPVVGGGVHQKPPPRAGGWGSDGEPGGPRPPGDAPARHRPARALPPDTRL